MLPLVQNGVELPHPTQFDINIRSLASPSQPHHLGCPTCMTCDMTLSLPELLSRYFAAQNALDAELMTACFAPDAVVHDEGGTYVGSEAIRGWKHDTIARYSISIDPLKATEQDNRTVVVARVAGNFPGSPANLTYAFSVSPEGLIKTLDIH